MINERTGGNDTKAVLIGAGSRGMHAYASYGLKNPHEIKFSL